MKAGEKNAHLECTMMRVNQLIVFLPLLGSGVAGCFGRFLGSEGSAIMTEGQNLVLCAIVILGWIFIFRLFCVPLTKKYGFRLVYFMHLSILFFISFLRLRYT